MRFNIPGRKPILTGEDYCQDNVAPDQRIPNTLTDLKGPSLRGKDYDAERAAQASGSTLAAQEVTAETLGLEFDRKGRGVHGQGTASRSVLQKAIDLISSKKKEYVAGMLVLGGTFSGNSISNTNMQAFAVEGAHITNATIDRLSGGSDVELIDSFVSNLDLTKRGKFFRKEAKVQVRSLEGSIIGEKNKLQCQDFREGGNMNVAAIKMPYSDDPRTPKDLYDDYEKGTNKQKKLIKKQLIKIFDQTVWDDSTQMDPHLKSLFNRVCGEVKRMPNSASRVTNGKELTDLLKDSPLFEGLFDPVTDPSQHMVNGVQVNPNTNEHVFRIAHGGFTIQGSYTPNTKGNENLEQIMLRIDGFDYERIKDNKRLKDLGLFQEGGPDDPRVKRGEMDALPEGERGAIRFSAQNEKYFGAQAFRRITELTRHIIEESGGTVLPANSQSKKVYQFGANLGNGGAAQKARQAQANANVAAHRAKAKAAAGGNQPGQRNATRKPAAPGGHHNKGKIRW